MPDIIQRLKDAYAENPAKALELLPELFKQYDDGLIPVLPCKPHTFVWYIGEGGAIHGDYKLLGTVTQYGKMVYIVYHGATPYEHKLVDEVYFTFEAAEAALKERKT